LLGFLAVFFGEFVDVDFEAGGFHVAGAEEPPVMLGDLVDQHFFLCVGW